MIFTNPLKYVMNALRPILAEREFRTVEKQAMERQAKLANAEASAMRSMRAQPQPPSYASSERCPRCSYWGLATLPGKKEKRCSRCGHRFFIGAPPNPYEGLPTRGELLGLSNIARSGVIR